MPKGLYCPVCGRFTVHPLTTNWRQCSNCRTKMPEKGILVVLRRNKPKVLLKKSKTLEKALSSKERTEAQKRVTMPDFQEHALKAAAAEERALKTFATYKRIAKTATEKKDSK